MTTQYFKRFRMECDLSVGPVVVPVLPPHYRWVAWQAGQEDRHALAKFHSFRDEVDAEVFDCLGDYHGCLRLMHEIVKQPGFLPGATWLLTHAEPDARREMECGTIQVVATSAQLASIQNVGVAPPHRGLGLGRALVLQCLAGCQAAGMQRVYLEVTAHNVAAVELYRSVGFKITRTMYRSVVYDGLEV